MKKFFKTILQKKIVLGVVVVFLGFFCASFVFKFLTNEKQSISIATVTPSLTLKPEIHKPEPVTEPIKDYTIKNEASVSDSDKEIITKDSTQHKEKDESVKEKEIPTLILNGIFSSKAGNFALINNHIVKEGDLILGVRVSKIYTNGVEIDADGKKVTLRIK